MSKKVYIEIDIQKHTVYPVHSNVFKFGTAGIDSTGEQMKMPKDMETFEVAIDGNVEEWSPMDQEGWTRRLMTAKSISITLNGKRNYGDDGNDYIAGLALLTGNNVTTAFEWTLPNGAVLTMNAVVNVSSFAGGDSTAVDALEVEVMSDGKPVFNSTSLVLLTFLPEAGSAAGNTKITSVVPTLTVSNSYVYKVNGSLPTVNEELDASWASYTLGDDIVAATGNLIALVEVNGDGEAQKGGTAASVSA